MSTPPSWLVLNQFPLPAFEQLLARLSRELGPGCLLTGERPRIERHGRLRFELGPRYVRGSRNERVVAWLRYMGWSTAKLVALLRHKPFVLAVTNPPMLVQLTWLLSTLRGSRYGLLIYDIYPEHMEKMGWLAQGGVLAETWRALNGLALRRADAVITLGQGMAETLREHAGSDIEIVVIPNWADTDWIRPRAKQDNPFAREHDQLDKVTVMYSGNMGGSHGMEAIAEAARLLRDVEAIHFLLIGDGLGRASLEEAKAKHGLDNMTLLPMQPLERLPLSLACADIALVSQAQGSEHLSVPSKTYSLLAAGAALVALTSERSDLARLVLHEQVGAVSAQRGEALAETLRELAADREALQAMRARARQAAEARYNEDAVYAAFREVLGRAMGAGGGCLREGGRLC